MTTYWQVLAPGELRMRLVDWPTRWECWALHVDPELVIDQADPVIVVTTDWLELISRPGVPFIRRDDDLLLIMGSNRRALYRVCESDLTRRLHVLRMPGQ